MSQSQTTSQENALATAPIGKLLFSLAVPAITAQVVNMLYNIVDRIYIGHIPEIGTAALTGVGITFPIITLISAFSSLIAMGGAPRASIAMGAHHKERAEEIMGNCFTALLALSCAGALAAAGLSSRILSALGALERAVGVLSGRVGAAPEPDARERDAAGREQELYERGLANILAYGTREMLRKRGEVQ